MRELASGAIAGSEARGHVRVVAAPDGTRTVEVTDFWVAPGAPDVRLYASARGDGVVDETSTELGTVADGEATQSWSLPVHLSGTSTMSVTVYCGVYSVYFGHAELRWSAE